MFKYTNDNNLEETSLLLLVAGISFAISLSLWAWSLTQTSIANSTLLNNMMPIFTLLEDGFFSVSDFPPGF